ncbi:MAG TPA: hypothetical protein VL463_36220 [Kofleriaceae bacterium]|nr:hypothetical protein [Kofleriaceae bacterium]
MDARAPLPLDAASPIAIKRDVHDFEIAADAAGFARAFKDVVIDPEIMFGLIRVRRPEARAGRDFAIGERFQGCFSLERALLGALERGGFGRAKRAAAVLCARPAIARAITWIEDAMLSDYAEIEELDLEPAPGSPYRLRYRYLDGTPIAGSSVFSVEPAGAKRCRVRQIFEYQEVNAIALGTFQRFGLKFHDQVVHMQIHEAAARLGAEVLRSTIPVEYARMVH